MSRLDLVLVNPGDRNQVYQTLGQTGLTAVETPVWPGLIASYALRRGCSVEIIDANAERLSPEQVADRIDALQPRLVAVVVYGHNPSASTQMMPAATGVCDEIKRQHPHQNVLLIGGHVAALPARTLRETGADFVATGEGLITVVALVERLRSSTSSIEDDSVPGLMYRVGDQLRTTPAPPSVTDLDGDIGGMPWSMLPPDRYVAHNWHSLGFPDRTPYAALYTTLGCPYRCEFCCIQAPFKAGEQALGLKGSTNSYRAWSPDLIVRELRTLVEGHGVRHVKIADEMFVLNRRHVGGICQGIIDQGLGDALNIWAYARVDTVENDRMIAQLKRAGFNWLCFGIEAASSRVRDDVAKGFDQDAIYKTIRRVRGAGINVIANFIVGLPEDDMETMRETLDFALELQCEWFNIYSAMAYPGSALYDRALAQGWQLPADWSGYSQHSVDCLPLPTKYASAGDVLSFRDDAFQRYFSDAGYLAMVSRKFGESAVDQIRQMTAHRLVRRHATSIDLLKESHYEPTTR